MTRRIIALAVAGTVLAGPVLAHERYRGPVYSDSNKFYLDYKTDISEAKRELESDLRRADDPASREDAWAEYHREIADAKHDFRKEMAERGVVIRKMPEVYVED